MHELLAFPIRYIGATALWSVAAVAATVAVVYWTADHDTDLGELPVHVATRAAATPRWLSSPLWWHAFVGIALWVLLGDGMPIWITAVVGIVVGALDGTVRGRFVLVVALPALWFQARTVAIGTGCITGTGQLGSMVPAGALLAAWFTTRPSRRFDAPMRWWAETVALLAVAATTFVLVPVRVTFGLLAEHVTLSLLAAGTIAGVATLVLAGMRGAAVGGLGTGVVVMSMAQVLGPSICAGDPWGLLVCMAATALGAASVAATPVGRAGSLAAGPAPRSRG